MSVQNIPAYYSAFQISPAQGCRRHYLAARSRGVIIPAQVGGRGATGSSLLFDYTTPRIWRGLADEQKIVIGLSDISLHLQGKRTTREEGQFEEKETQNAEE